MADATKQRRGPGRPPILTREQIIATAIDIVEETGTLRVAEIGKRLGVDTSTMYRYFDNRSHLVSAVAESFTSPLREPLPATDSWRNDVVALVQRAITLYRSRPSLALLILTEADLTGPSLQVVVDGAQALGRSGAPEKDVFAALHGIEIAAFGSIAYDTIGGPMADEIRRTYHRRIGVFDIDRLFPTAAELESESVSTMWLMVNSMLDWLERRAQSA